MQTRRFVPSPIKLLLLERGLSQRQLAQDIQASYMYLNMVLNGWEKGSPELRSKIANYFDVPEAELFPESEPASTGQEISQ